MKKNTNLLVAMIGLALLFRCAISYAWLTNLQNAASVLNAPGFNTAGYLAAPGDGLLFNHPMNIATDDAHLLLADTRNNRILIWNSLPTGNVPPDIVLGQPDRTANYPGSSLSEFNWPVGVSAAADKVVVADTWNHRILIWKTFPSRNGQAADIAIDNLPVSGLPPVQRGFDGSWPWAVWTDGTKLIVTATQASKVLIWNTFPSVSNQAPDIVLDGASAGLNTPRSIGTDGRTFLVIGDHNANPPSMFWNYFPTANVSPQSFAKDNPNGTWDMMRGGVLTSSGKFVILTPPGLSIWDGVPTSASQAASLFVGRSSTGNPPEYDQKCTSSGYYFEEGDGSHLAITSSGKVYISLYNGNKIVGYNALPTRTEQCPDFVIGAPNLATDPYLESFVQNPALASNGTSLVAGSDYDNSFTVWRTAPRADSTKPDYTVRFTGFSPNAVAAYGNIWASVGNSHELRFWRGLPDDPPSPFPGAPAGEGNMLGSPLGPTIGPVTLQSATGIALDAQYLYVADRSAGKVYGWTGLPSQTSTPTFTLNIPGAERMSSDGQYLAVSDGNVKHKVYLYRVDSLSSSATPVAEFPPAGASYNFSLGPAGVLLVNGHLFVVDTVFGRILAWYSIADAIAGNDPDVLLGARTLGPTMNSASGSRNMFVMANNLAYLDNKLWVGEFKFQSRILGFDMNATTEAGVAAGWNLLGNSNQYSVDVSTIFGDATRVRSIWKWDASNARWAVYVPGQIDGGAAWASSHGYAPLVTIAAGDGFWVDAIKAFTAQLPMGAPITGAAFRALTPGWHLVSIGELETPAVFNANIPVTSLWTWETSSSKWFFFAPSLQSQGGGALIDYVTANGYLDFTAANKTLGPGVGFWVNIP